jgi:hypothetical protein
MLCGKRPREQQRPHGIPTGILLNRTRSHYAHVLFLPRSHFRPACSLCGCDLIGPEEGEFDWNRNEPEEDPLALIPEKGWSAEKMRADKAASDREAKLEAERDAWIKARKKKPIRSR